MQYDTIMYVSDIYTVKVRKQGEARKTVTIQGGYLQNCKATKAVTHVSVTFKVAKQRKR